MANRPLWHKYASTRVTTTGSTSYVEGMALDTFTPPASTTLLVLWSAILDTSNATGDAKCRLWDGSSTLDEAIIKNANSTSNRFPIGGARLITTSASPSPLTLSLQYGNVTTAAYTAGLREMCIVVIPLIAGVDFWNSAASSSSVTTAMGSTDKVTLSFTPPTTGDYLIIGKCSLNAPTSANGDAGCRLYNGSTAYRSTSPIGLIGTAAVLPWFGIVRANNLSGSQTWKVQPGRVTNNINASYAVLVALRISELVDFYYTDAAGPTNTTSTVLTYSPSVDVVPHNRVNIMLSCANFSHSSATTMIKGALGITGSTNTYIRPVGATTAKNPCFMMRSQNLSENGNNPVNVSQAYCVNSAGTTTVEEQVVCVFRVNSKLRPPSVCAIF